MEEIVVVVFDSQLKAVEALRVLRELDHDNEISLYDAQIISKGSGGAVRVMDNVDALRFPLVGGSTTVGALIGLLGGPWGALVGATAGGLIGSFGDIKEEGVTEEFVNDVKTALTPEKSALVADLEQWVPSVDARMKLLGGVVLRARVRDVVEKSEKEFDAATHRAEMDELKAERAKASADRLAKIDAKIDELRAKFESSIEHRRVRMQLHQQQREAKIKALQAKAEQSQGEIQRRQQARIAELRQDYSAKTKAG